MQAEAKTNLPVPSHISDALPAFVSVITETKKNITENFYTLGQCLAEVRNRHLYKGQGFDNFYQFLRDKQIDISPKDAERFIAITEDSYLRGKVNLGLSKMLELLKLEPPQRYKLLQEGVNIDGAVKSVEQLNLSELKKATTALRHQNQTRCDRCGRWVDKAKEIDGKFYGSGGTHSCYEAEMEERRELSEGRIPHAQLDTVLQTLRPPELEEEKSVPLTWLPDSLYQLYGQLLQEQENLSGEVSVDSLKKEKETLQKLIRLCQSRLRDIQETVQLLKELDREN